MSKLVILNLGKGNLHQGFSFVVARLQSGEKTKQFVGSLPPAPEILELYYRWQLFYDLLYKARSFSDRRSISEDITIDEADVTHVSEMDLMDVSQQLQQSINNWLDTEDFRGLERQLRSYLNPTDEIRVIIQTEEHQIRQIPWHIWQFFQDYPRAEVAFSSFDFESKTQGRSQATGVRILTILGDATGIDIEADRRMLENLPQAETVFLVEPPRWELDRQLWDERGWDLLFFAGHSLTQGDGETGQIYLNSEQSLTIKQLHNALNKAIDNGLQLAIFNSCDGLGLARQLSDLHIPQMIVMREPIADRVAQEFLKNFLQLFIGGKSFYLAVREARERLQGLESEFPGASWLPVIFQNLAETPPSWKQWCNSGSVQQQGAGSFQTFLTKNNLQRQHYLWLLQTSVFTTAIVMVLRLLGLLQTFELQAFDHLMRRRPHEEPDKRILIVRATSEDLKMQQEKPQNKVFVSLSDRTLSQVLGKLQSYQPSVIGLDIYRDFAVSPEYPELQTFFQQNHLFGICKIRDPEAGDLEGVAPTPEIPPERFGFSDAITDRDGILRRHLLSMKPQEPTDPCIAQNHLSFLLALYYLDTQYGIEFKNLSEKALEITIPSLDKKLVLKGLQPSMKGGYQRADLGGRQILLNYRSLSSPLEIADTLSFQDLLQDKIRPEKIAELQHRIVLIGVGGSVNENTDYWLTPYSINYALGQSKIPGVFVQAHMISQLLSALLDDRPLIWVLPLWGEIAWIWVWSLGGGLIAIYFSSPKGWAIAIPLALSSVYGISYLFLCQGGWLSLIPSSLALLLSSGSMVLMKFKTK
ncbi:MAG: hypothetical protein Tsb0014_05100 [Pleurocapsa sp.]